MKLRITLDGVTYELDVEFVEADEETRSTTASAPAPVNTPSAPAARKKAPPPSAPPPKSAASEGYATDKNITSPLSGTVSKVLVKVGDSVKTNQGLLILEAMKMETNVVAAMDGVIKKIAISEGEAVSQGQPLIEFE